ncbi:hypothetical protein KRP22_010679 [Phytophthora ramorum]|nr:Chromatin-remodeling ATPase INO80 [Phytophthora ramorum]
MADGSTRADGAATGVTHASALALLADSSAARSNKPGKSTAHTQETRSEVDSELGRVILKLEKARARVGASLTQIPTGREYDSPPDVSDEPTYDALEKAYNAAFLVHTPETVEHVHIEEPVVRQEEKLGVEDSVKLGGSAAEDAEKQREGKEKDTTQVGTLKSICLSTLNQHTKNGAQSESQGTGVINGISARAATASPSQSPMSVPNRTSSEDGFLSTPEVKRGCRDVAMKPEDAEEGKVERADHISLKEFLVSELEVYCSRLVERKHPQNGSSDACDLAWITGLQLYQDHERALMDFDDEWKRSHANSYPGYANEGHEELQMSPLTIITNPFQQDTAGSAKSNVQEGSKDLYASYKRGSNGVVIGDSCHKERLKISEFMAQIASSQNTSAFYVVVAAGSDLAQWEKALLSNQLIQLYPYWGSKEDRQNLLQLLSNEYFSNHNLSAHVLLTSYEVFMEDISVVTSLQCQLSVIDIPQAADKITAIWPQLLSLRCRQRLLLCQPGFEIDARKLLHFLVPELFSSRRKLLAWSSAALHINQIRQVCDVVEAFTLISNSDASRAFISKVESCTKENCEREMAALDTLDKQGIVRAIEPSIMVPVRRVLNKKSRNRVNGHIPATGKLAAQSTLPDPVEPQLTIQAPNVPPRKRTDSDRSRQRIGRCGKCAGCLAEDCMKCGHCQDMKKYGGPGLRKQSCKNRKCLNPKIWGYATRKRKRSKTKRASDPHKSGNSTKGDSDDDASNAYSSVESDGDSVSTTIYGHGDSDEESLRYSDAAMDSPRDLLLPASDTLLDDHLSLSDLSSRSGSARQRVVRCGECEGCHAPDCMKCPHCLDMKKYGGPGLRKQTCKNRKCNSPKLVVLNKAKGGHDQYVDEMGNVVYSGLNDGTFPGFYEAPDASDRPESPESVGVSPKVESPSVIEACKLFVEPQLVFACKDCVARFSSKLLLDFHERVEHSLPTSQHVIAPTAFEREASLLFTRPICQNAMLCAQTNQLDRNPRSSPLGYAKLQSQQFQYFFMEPFVILGRMEARWCELYKHLGVANLKGLAGGDVNCHVGNDSMIATTHAVISWDARLGSFVIECLSLRTPISVNGREVSFSSPPATLSSRNLVQIGASVFYFLLPKTTKTI